MEKEIYQSSNETDEEAINGITARFFSLFTNTDGKVPQVEEIRDFFLPGGLIVNSTEDTPAIYDLDGFIKPRKEILTNGTLKDFCEKETSYHLEINGNIANRFCRYEKSGQLNGNYFEETGWKTIQFIKINQKWTMSSVAWSDN